MHPLLDTTPSGTAHLGTNAPESSILIENFMLLEPLDRFGQSNDEMKNNDTKM
jgi:hypothetical protein